MTVHFRGGTDRRPRFYWEMSETGPSGTVTGDRQARGEMPKVESWLQAHGVHGKSLCFAIWKFSLKTFRKGLGWGDGLEISTTREKVELALAQRQGWAEVAGGTRSISSPRKGRFPKRPGLPVPAGPVQGGPCCGQGGPLRNSLTSTSAACCRPG